MAQAVDRFDSAILYIGVLGSVETQLSLRRQPRIATPTTAPSSQIENATKLDSYTTVQLACC